MAHIYPQKEDLADVPYSEIRVYELLENYRIHIMYSTRFNGQKKEVDGKQHGKKMISLS